MNITSGLIFIPILLYILLFISLAVIVVYGFILLVRFLRAGTTAFNIYIEKNRMSISNGIENERK